MVTTQEYYECDVAVYVANFWVNATGCHWEFHVGFKDFQDLKNVILNVFKEKSLALWAIFSKKQTDSAWKFLQPPMQVWRGASILHFKSNAPVSVDPSFSNIHDSGQYQQNGKRTYCWYCSVPSPSRIHLFIFLWTTKVFIFPNYF